MEKIKKLIEKLNNASYEYYVNANEIMSDLEYDKLYDELVKLEESTGIVFNNSPTIKVGYTVLSQLDKVTHKYPMLSLNKTKEIEKLKEFLRDGEGLLSWKMDGLTVILTYNNGELIQAVTRGNGIIGEDITHNAKVFVNVPNKINYKGELVVRGEAVITYDSFEKINAKLPPEQKYKNPRNLCSGTVRQLNNEVAKDRAVLFFGFSVVNENDFNFEDKKSNSYKFLMENGIELVEYKIVTEETVENVVNEFKENIKNLQYGTDGLVITYNSYELSQSLGTTSKFPKDSVAFKWADELAETTLREILWRTSRTGVVTPVAIFDSVELEGTSVNRASLHNISIIESLELGIGDTVKVYKANMIIPQIGENLTRTNNIEIPDKCPTCEADTEIVKVKDGKALYCTNEYCEAKIIDGLVHFVSRNAMDIVGLSEATIEKFVEKKYVNSFSDFFKLSEYKDDIMSMEGFGEKSYEKLIASIEKSRKVKLPNFIYSLGINQVGLSNAKLLVKEICKDGDVTKLFDVKLEELVNIEGFGEIIGENILKYFSNENKLEEVKKLLKHVSFELEEFENSMDGIVVVITGSLEKFANRNELSELIEKKGGKVSSSVSKNTTYLINNDKKSSSSKNKKAISLNVPIVNEDEFIQLFSL